jgi:hypothetical protein
MIFHFELFGRYNWCEAMGETRDGFARNGNNVASCGGKPVRERERQTGRPRLGWEKNIKM